MDPIQLLSFLAQAGDAPAGGSPLFSMLLMYGLLFGGLYFLMIAPQRKRAKEHAKLLSELKGGDQVLTASGIFGSVVSIKGDRVVVKIADNARVEMLKSAIQSVIKDEDEKPKS